jgi:DNA-binding beta-propeller fold protein YncE
MRVHGLCRPKWTVRALIPLVAAVLGAAALAVPAVAAPQVVTIDVGGEPTSVAVNSVTGTAYVTDASTGTVSVIDSRSAEITAIIVVGGVPGDIAVDEVTNRVYVTNPDGGTVAVIDGSSNLVVSVIGAGIGASVVDVDSSANRVYVGSRSTGEVAVLDGISSAMIALIPSDVQVLSGVSVDPGRKLAYFSSLDTDTVEIFDTAALKFVGSTRVGRNPAGIAVHRGTGTVYVANSGIHHMSVVDGPAKIERKTILLRSEASAVAVREATNIVYTNGGPNGLVKIDGETGAISGELPLGVNPGAVAADQRANDVYVTDPLHGKVFLVRDF